LAGIDLQQLLGEVAGGAPCGDNLEYDPAFAALERAVEPRSDRMTGAAEADGDGPDWADVARRAVALFDRSKDLRVGIYLARALLQTEGLGGFRDALLLLHHLVSDCWETVHPLLDPDDDNDPTLRVNTLATLNDADTVLRELRSVPLIVSRNFGPVSWRDVALATGELRTVDGETPRDVSEVKAAFKDCDADALRRTATAAHEAGELVQSIEQAIAEQVGVGRAVDLAAVRSLLRSISRFLGEQLAERGLTSGSDAAEAAAVPTTAGSERTGARISIAGEVASRDDVIRLIDRACEYFARYEPSSPVPILLRRAQQLVGKDFMDILRDLAPDGVAQAQVFQVRAGADEG
jgi:type VI secretion system protein ImpA